LDVTTPVGSNCRVVHGIKKQIRNEVHATKEVNNSIHPDKY
jgi:hypothetical protein